MKKYCFAEQSMGYSGHTLHRIKALVDIPCFFVKAGDLGGWIESEKNLSHEGNAWVADEAIVYGEAGVSGNAIVYGNAKVYGKAQVYGNARVCDNAEVCGHAWVFGSAEICGNASVHGQRIVS